MRAQSAPKTASQPWLADGSTVSLRSASNKPSSPRLFSSLDVQRALYDICPKAKVIIITGELEPGIDRTIALDQGAIAFLFKPVNLSRLLEAIRTVYPVRN